MSFFTLQATCGQARAGTLQTAHGEVTTPIFMPVGTGGTVKCLWQEELLELGAQVILGNAYHLYLRPGHRLIAQVAGGLHKFINWPRAILTDSGGYQVFSLGDRCQVAEGGVRFRSHIDGSDHLISPEGSMEIQRALGGDLVMMFDQCPPLPNSRQNLRSSMERTLRWAERCSAFPLAEHQRLFAINQGGLELDLRLECLERLEELDPPGMAIGGLSVGEKSPQMRRMLEQLVPRFPTHKPRYLMGVGKPMDIIHAIAQGVDMFDCVLPTRNARNGQVLSFGGAFSIKNQRFRQDSGPLDVRCSCKVCRRYSRAYVRHLYQSGEYLAGQMLSYHNLFFYLQLVKLAREAIVGQRFDEFAQNFYNTYVQYGGE